MNALGLLRDLEARGVILEPCEAGERLKIEAPVGVLTGADRSALKEAKLKLLELLCCRAQRRQEVPTRESVARWAGPSLVKIRDPFTGKWHEWPEANCLPGVVAEADRRRKGDRWR